MTKYVLSVAEDKTYSFEFLNALSLDDAEVVFVDNIISTLRLLRSNDYDLILLGDRLADGDIRDVALDLKNNKNRQTPVVCVGYSNGRAHQLMRFLGYRAMFCKGGADPSIHEKAAAYLKEDVLKTEVSDS